MAVVSIITNTSTTQHTHSLNRLIGIHCQICAVTSALQPPQPRPAVCLVMVRPAITWQSFLGRHRYNNNEGLIKPNDATGHRDMFGKWSQHHLSSNTTAREWWKEILSLEQDAWSHIGIYWTSLG